MRIKYWWYESEEWNDGIFRPTCAFIEEAKEFKGLIFSFLNDDEGLGLDYLINWLEVGLIEIEKVEIGTSAFYDMWGHAWGAEITAETAVLYWGYDAADHKEKRDFDISYKIFTEWLNFIKAEASVAHRIEFEC